MRFILSLCLLLVVGCVSNSSTTSTQPTTGPTTRPIPRTLAEAIAAFEIDPRLTLCDVHEQNGRLVGVVESPRHRELLGRWLKKDVSKIRVLPEESGTTDRFGIVTAEHAILRKTPRDTHGDRDNVSDVLRGEPVWILDRQDGWTLVHSGDGYIGWAPPDVIGWTCDAKSFGEALSVALRPNARKPEAQGFASPAQLITGLTTQPAVATGVRLEDGRAFRARETREIVLAEARTFLGTPYVWGGKTKAGIDCSGLMQTSFARHGILLPRDADQQATVGRLVATRWMTEGLLPGDLLFFQSERRGNISHVALYLGAGKYIEAAGKDVHVSSLTPGDADYDGKRAATFAWARRVIE